QLRLLRGCRQCLRCGAPGHQHLVSLRTAGDAQDSRSADPGHSDLSRGRALQHPARPERPLRKAMDFSPAQFGALIQNIENGLNTAVSDANATISRIESATRWIPGIGSMIQGGLEKVKQLFEEFMAKVGEFLQWVTVPPTMWHFGQTWLD